jgi:hypothetical protein
MPDRIRTISTCSRCINHTISRHHTPPLLRFINTIFIPTTILETASFVHMGKGTELTFRRKRHAKSKSRIPHSTNVTSSLCLSPWIRDLPPSSSDQLAPPRFTYGIYPRPTGRYFPRWPWVPLPTPIHRYPALHPCSRSGSGIGYGFRFPLPYLCYGWRSESTSWWQSS